MCSAAATEFDSGALATMIPRLLAAGMSTLSTPVPARPIARRLVAFSISSGVIVVAERMMIASNSPIRRSSSAWSQSTPISTSNRSRSSSTPASAIFSLTRTFTSARPSTFSITQSIEAVSASTSAGSTDGNIPIRSWLRPSLRYGSVSTTPLARRVAAIAAASMLSSKSIVPTTSERFAGSATNGVAKSEASAQP